MDSDLARYLGFALSSLSSSAVAAQLPGRRRQLIIWREVGGVVVMSVLSAEMHIYLHIWMDGAGGDVDCYARALPVLSALERRGLLTRCLVVDFRPRGPIRAYHSADDAP